MFRLDAKVSIYSHPHSRFFGWTSLWIVLHFSPWGLTAEATDLTDAALEANEAVRSVTQLPDVISKALIPPVLVCPDLGKTVQFDPETYGDLAERLRDARKSGMGNSEFEKLRRTLSLSMMEKFLKANGAELTEQDLSGLQIKLMNNIKRIIEKKHRNQFYIGPTKSALSEVDIELEEFKVTGSDEEVAFRQQMLKMHLAFLERKYKISRDPKISESFYKMTIKVLNANLIPIPFDQKKEVSDPFRSTPLIKDQYGSGIVPLTLVKDSSKTILDNAHPCESGFVRDDEVFFNHDYQHAGITIARLYKKFKLKDPGKLFSFEKCLDKYGEPRPDGKNLTTKKLVLFYLFHEDRYPLIHNDFKMYQGRTLIQFVLEILGTKAGSPFSIVNSIKGADGRERCRELAQDRIRYFQTSNRKGGRIGDYIHPFAKKMLNRESIGFITVTGGSLERPFGGMPEKGKQINDGEIEDLQKGWTERMVLACTEQYKQDHEVFKELTIDEDLVAAKSARKGVFTRLLSLFKSTPKKSFTEYYNDSVKNQFTAKLKEMLEEIKVFLAHFNSNTDCLNLQNSGTAANP